MPSYRPQANASHGCVASSRARAWSNGRPDGLGTSRRGTAKATGTVTASGMAAAMAQQGATSPQQASLPGAPSPAAPPSSAAAAPLPPIDGLVPTRALTYLPGHEAIYRRVLGRFVDAQAADEAALVALAHEGAWAQLRKALHALRGSLGAIGAVELSATALALEQVAEGPLDEAERLRMTQEFDAALRALAGRIAVALQGPAHAGKAELPNADSKRPSPA